MLQQVLREIEQAHGPLRLADLARKLEIDQGTLEGMIDFWVRKGRIAASDTAGEVCGTGGCGGCSSTSDRGCPFAGTAPRTFALVPEETVPSVKCGCKQSE